MLTHSIFLEHGSSNGVMKLQDILADIGFLEEEDNSGWASPSFAIFIRSVELLEYFLI
jgi:hypothetical protein